MAVLETRKQETKQPNFNQYAILNSNSMKTTINNCEYCEKQFETKRSDARFCSPACKQQAYLQRKTTEESDDTGSTDIERREKAQNELEEAVEALNEMWDEYIKNETNLPELKRKFTAFTKAYEIVAKFNESSKSLLFTDLSKLPACIELSKRIDIKCKELKG